MFNHPSICLIVDELDAGVFEYLLGELLKIIEQNGKGQLVFTSTGYQLPWDGKFKDQPLPVATYYYIIDPKNGRDRMSGSVTILR